ncbi:MAG: pyridoxal 5'-phosphate synthase glutaminase subunit PdxT [Dehalococcoidia bacterium]|nr:pyridoxal 5'-phosphate synthase glutaminase subunit PdxT [Dehalococcoidia bacterium]
MVNTQNGNTPRRPRIGVLALQGDFAEHIHMLGLIGISAVEVRKVQQLSEIDGLIVPGGESTTIVKLLARFGFIDELHARVEAGMALWGTCAGMIVIARELADPYPTPLNLLDIGVARNYFGRQVDSFEAELAIDGIEGGPLRAVFIRAPIVTDTGDGIEVIATVNNGQVVAVKKDRVLATSFHPELTNDTRIHALFVQMADEALKDSVEPSGETRMQASPGPTEESPSTV